MNKKLLITVCCAIMSSAVFAHNNDSSKPSTGHWMVTCSDNTAYFYCGVDNNNSVTQEGFYPASPFPVSLIASCPAGTNSIDTEPTKNDYTFYNYVYSPAEHHNTFSFAALPSVPTSCSGIKATQVPPMK